MKKLGIRRRLLLVVVAAVALAIIGLVAGFNIVLGHTLARDARSLARSRAVAQLSSLKFQHGKLTAGETPDERASDAYIWVFQGDRTIEQPNRGKAANLAARSLAAGSARYLDVPSEDTRLASVPIVETGERVGTVIAGVSLAPYEETRRTALVASLVFGGLVLLVVGAAAWWLLGAALRPVVRMTRQAADWSEHEPDHRFALGPPHDELTELAATLDNLLDRLAASLRHERRFSAELSHELRTPLTRVLAESELALRRERRPEEYREALEVVHRGADQLARTVDALVAAARYEAGGDRGAADAEAVACGAAAACSGLAAERKIEVDVAPADRSLRVGLDADLAERILQPIIENACRYGSSRVHIAVEREDSMVVYAIEDDGSGVTEDEREQIFDPGVRGAAGETYGNASGAGLGLSLARRLARTVDGDVYAKAANRGLFVIRLPSG